MLKHTFQWITGGLLLTSIVGCDDIEVDGAPLAGVEQIEADERSAEPIELSEEDGLHHFAPGEGPVSEVFRLEDSETLMSFSDAPEVQGAPPAWCKVGTECSWCEGTCGLLWPLGGTWVITGVVEWINNNQCVCHSRYQACEWISGCAG